MRRAALIVAGLLLVVAVLPLALAFGCVRLAWALAGDGLAIIGEEFDS